MAAIQLENTCNKSNNAQWLEIGRSEENRPIFGAVIGNGPLAVSLIAESHSDEPV